MNRLYQEIENLKQSLEEEQQIKELVESLKKIKKNQKLIDKIKKYHQNPSKELEKEIMATNEIKEYKHLETEVNFLILEMRQELKKITGKRGC